MCERVILPSYIKYSSLVKFTKEKIKIMIKNKKTLIAAAAFSSLVLSSCSDMLDDKIGATYTDDITWGLSEFSIKVLTTGYGYLATTFSSFNSNFLDVVTDNACTTNYGTGVYNYVHGSMTASNNFYDNWETCYEVMQYIHLYLQYGVDESLIYSLSSESEDAAIRKRCQGEAYWLRAWWCYDLLQRFGGLSDAGEALGYPIVTCYIPDDIQGITDLLHFNDVKLGGTYDELRGSNCTAVTNFGSSYWNNVPRNTYEECVAQIIADCDKAYELLEFEYADTNADAANSSSHIGRADGKCALALKARVTMLAASPAYQPDGQSDADLLAKWNRATEAAYDAINRMGQDYTPFECDWYVGTDVQTNEIDDFIFRRWTNNKTLEQYHFPPRFAGNAYTQPSQNLVDAFPMADGGYPITDSRSGYKPQDPYTGRDTRLERTVYRNDDQFGDSSYNLTRDLQIYTTSTGVLGLDVEGDHYQNTKTGYYIRKTMSVHTNMLYDGSTLTTSNDYHQHPFLRVGELYYILAEALNASVGPTGSSSYAPGYTAKEIIGEIRAANGITNDLYLEEVSADAASFQTMLLNERRIEFAFENLRFMDLRRNLLPMDTNIYGVKVTKDVTGLSTNEDGLTGTYDAAGNFTEVEIFSFEGTDPSAPILVEDRSSLKSAADGGTFYYHYLPIPQNEMLQNSSLIQNKGW